MTQIAGRYANLRSQLRSGERESVPGEDSGQTRVSPNEPDDELVRLVADRVYQRLLQDLRIDRERLRGTAKKRLFRKGGR
jgi:hypothetical protein